MAEQIDPHPVIATLCQKFPACFDVQFEQRRRPLAIGIHKEILAAMPALSANFLADPLARPRCEARALATQAFLNACE